MKITVNSQKCPQNHRCPSIAVCPQGAITQWNIYSLPEINEKKCIVCGKCIKIWRCSLHIRRLRLPSI